MRPILLDIVACWGDISPSIQPQPRFQGGRREKIRLGDEIFKVSRRIGNQLWPFQDIKISSHNDGRSLDAGNICIKGGKSFYPSNLYKDSEMMECCDNIELAVGLILRDEGGKFLQLLFIQRTEMCQ